MVNSSIGVGEGAATCADNCVLMAADKHSARSSVMQKLRYRIGAD